MSNFVTQINWDDIKENSQEHILGISGIGKKPLQVDGKGLMTIHYVEDEMEAPPPEPIALIHIPEGTPDERADTVISLLELLNFSAVKLRKRWDNIRISALDADDLNEELIEDAILSLAEQGHYGMIDGDKFSIYKQT